MSGNSSATDPGIRVDGGQLWVDRGRVIGNDGGGIVAENGAELVLRNCFVGGASPDVDAIAINGATLDMLYTTVGGGSVILAQTRALFCAGDANVDVRNSILVSLDDDPEVECVGAILTNSAIESEVGVLDASWFGGYATGDFSLTPMGTTTFQDIAQWQDGDPLTDIDGTARPGTNGASDYAGADVP